MTHSFKVALTDEISSVLKKVESEITGGGGTFQGNTEKGTFAGKSLLGSIKGEYQRVSESELNITITAKPFLVQYNMIETGIRKYFG